MAPIELEMVKSLCCIVILEVLRYAVGRRYDSGDIRVQGKEALGLKFVVGKDRSLVRLTSPLCLWTGEKRME